MLGFGILRMWTIQGPRQKFGAGQNNNVAPNDAREGVTVLLTTPFANNIRFEVPFRPSVTLVRFANDKRRWMCAPCHSNSRPLVRTSPAPSCAANVFADRPLLGDASNV